MQPAVLIRLRPAGPWRYGPGNGGRDRVDSHFRSDRLFSAVTLAMKRLGWLDEWIAATVKAPVSAVAFTSLFPYQGQTLFVRPPATLWPPPAGLLTTPSPVFLSKIRWKAAAFVPAALVETILLGQTILADQWLPDPESECLLRRDRLNATPFRTVMRSGAAVDRLTASTAAVHASACVEFEQGSGLWAVLRFRDESAQSDWGQRVRAAFRLLADEGFGGKRTSGWGQSEPPEFQEGSWPALLFPKLARAASMAQPENENDAPEPPLHWLLSVFTPSESDVVDWSAGDYSVLLRGGYVDSAPSLKKEVRMIAEGSVLASADDLKGTAVDVAPDGYAHPVYRSGIALSFRLPVLPAAPPDANRAELEEILTELEAASAQDEPRPEPEAEQRLAQEEPPPAEAAVHFEGEPQDETAGSEPAEDAESTGDEGPEHAI
jgi:CRISPR type III-A-associated RAMP protein Csm4